MSSIYEFLEMLPPHVRNLPTIQAMAHHINGQATILQKQSAEIEQLKKTLEGLQKPKKQK